MTVQNYYLHVADFAHARGSDPAVSFHGSSLPAFTTALSAALRDSVLFDRWLAAQPDPEAVDPTLDAVDAQATVTGTPANAGAGGDLTVATSLPFAVLKHRLRLLIGSHWTLGDVNRA